MAALAFRNLVRLASVTALAFAVTLVLTHASSAAEHQLPGTHGFGSVAAECGSRSGVFTVSTDGSYGCAIEGAIVDCTAKGSCVCSGKNCAAVVKGGLRGVRSPPSSTGSLSSPSGTPTRRKIPIDNIRTTNLTGGNTSGGTHQPAMVQHGGGHSGGGRH